VLSDFGTASENAAFNADICIVGAGAAGITIAKELVPTGKQILLLEGGDIKYSEESQSLYHMTRDRFIGIRTEAAFAFSEAAPTIGTEAAGPTIRSISKRAPGCPTAAGRFHSGTWSPSTTAPLSTLKSGRAYARNVRCSAASGRMSARWLRRVWIFGSVTSVRRRVLERNISTSSAPPAISPF
jgi:choline dehydrogenase-like flavoprotein